MKEDKQIFVFYLGVGDMNQNDIEDYIDKVKNRFFTPSFIMRNECEIFIIPTRETDSKLECINPVYITDAKLIEDHEKMMKDFDNSLYNIKKGEKK